VSGFAVAKSTLTLLNCPMITATPPNSIAIWERAIQPSRRTLDPSSAKALLGLKLSKRDLDRADTLANLASGGQLTDAESAELESYRSVGTALEFLKSKARRSLAGTR
jgi:hypothetical protein